MKGSGTTKTSSSRNPKGLRPRYSAQEKSEYTNLLASSIVSFSQSNVNHNASGAGLNLHHDVVGVIEKIGKGDYGVATEIAKQYIARQNKLGTINYQLSDKQSHVLAKAAVENSLTQNSMSAALNYEKLKQAAKHPANNIKNEAKKSAYNSTYQRSSTKVAVGSAVKNAKGVSGTITKIITPSTGYVEVNYNGTIKKEMAFNLFGEDGHPLKKKKF